MSSNYKPWWEKVGEISSPSEQREFIRGVGGSRPAEATGNAILLSIIAGYVGYKAIQRIGNKK